MRVRVGGKVCDDCIWMQIYKVWVSTEQEYMCGGGLGMISAAVERCEVGDLTDWLIVVAPVD